MTPQEYCQDKAAKSGSSFYYSFLFLPPDKRAAITALYAFCREVDDIADECHEREIARTKLAWWRAELANMYTGAPNHPVTRALLPALGTYDLPREAFEEILDGMEMDLDRERYANFKSLQLYCHRVAGVVGELSARIFGFRAHGTLSYAQTLGLAFQMTNIIRDVGEDARRGRIYLPQDEMAKFGVREADILAARSTAEFTELMRYETRRARALYTEALAQLAPEDRATQKPGLVMARIYSALLDEIERDGFKVLNQKTSLTPIRKLWLAWRTWVFG